MDVLADEIDHPHRGIDAQVDLRMTDAKAFEARHQPFGCDRWRSGHGEQADAVALTSARHRFGDALESVAQPRQAGLTRIGQAHRAIETAEELHAEIGLERFDLMADRRRRHAQLLGRGVEAEMARGGLEGTQRVERRQAGHGFRLDYLF
jgi:hypothetical protein